MRIKMHLDREKGGISLKAKYSKSYDLMNWYSIFLGMGGGAPLSTGASLEFTPSASVCEVCISGYFPTFMALQWLNSI